mmetsp:Transcript_9722/g.16653  ORF Transcript_9722/g.16653 Transcript_9722/m.16653 type:complete len:175 (-) Transcript_9722:1880-2404(-)
MERLLPALSALSVGVLSDARKRARANAKAEAEVSPLAWARRRLAEARKEVEGREGRDVTLLCDRLEECLKTLENESVGSPPNAEQVQSAIHDELGRTSADYLTVGADDAPESLRTLVLWSVEGVCERDEEERARDEARRGEEPEMMYTYVHGGGKCKILTQTVRPKPSRQTSGS